MTWMCPGCGMENGDDQRECPLCHTVRPLATPKAGTSRASVSTSIPLGWGVSLDSPAPFVSKPSNVPPFPAVPDYCPPTTATAPVAATEAPACAPRDTAAPQLKLTDIRTGRVLSAAGATCEIGREAPGCLAAFGEMAPELSRRHLMLSYHDDEWYAEDLGSTNGSVLYRSGHRFDFVPGVELEVRDGDELILAARRMFLRVAIEAAVHEEAPSAHTVCSGDSVGPMQVGSPAPTPQPRQAAGSAASENASPDDTTVEGYFITCKTCKRVFQVTDRTSRLNVCPECGNEQLAFERARYGVQPVRKVTDVR